MTFKKGHKLWKHPNCEKGRFKKGMIPWHKGKVRAGMLGENNPSKRPEVRQKLREKMLGRVIPEEWRIKIRETLIGRESPFKGKPRLNYRGENAPNWKGGITPVNVKIRSSLENKLWREAVFKRDNWTCVWCGARSKEGMKVVINADHIKPFALFPELRFSVDNGRTLCTPCHKKTDTFAGKTRKVAKV